MGASFSNWADVADSAYYVGAGGSGPLIWLWVSIALCVLACWMGHRHETAANAE